MNRAINRSHYLTPPAVWGDDRPLGARETTRPTGQVNLGDLIVFGDEHGNAYQVGGIDHLPEQIDPDGTWRATIRFNCGDGERGIFPNPALFWEGDAVTVLEIPRLDWQRDEAVQRLHIDATYAGYLTRDQTKTPPVWEVHYWDDYLERHCQIGACPQRWIAERLLAATALGIDLGKDYLVTLPSGCAVSLLTVDRATLESVATLAEDDHGDELKVDTGRVQVWLTHGTRTWDLPGHGQFRLTDAIYMRERPDRASEVWDVTSVWK
ncbi:hypothetical protein [Actinomadura gamaensis]|uniref:Uncharacterized protein n=1 Tax=Actinomadura gamaensis TaxID=1763541 RepID=A0ABV9U8V1_9ACTN